MSSPAITIFPDASIVAAARMFDQAHVSHLVVTEVDDTLAGIVAPLDLLKVCLRTDGEIRHEIVDEVITNYLGCDPRRAEVNVTDGLVTLRGEVEPGWSCRQSQPAPMSTPAATRHLTCLEDEAGQGLRPMKRSHLSAVRHRAHR